MELTMTVPVLVSVFFTLVAIFRLFQFISRRSHKGTPPPRAKLPPGPPPLPIIGNLLDLGDKPHMSLAKLAQDYGPIISLKLGNITTIVISSSSLAKQVFRAHDLALSDRPVMDMARAEGHHERSLVFLPAEAPWRNLRRICNNQVFSTQRLDANRHIRREKIRVLLADVQESCRSGLAVHVGRDAFKATLNALSSTIFSLNLSESGDVLVSEFKQAVRSFMDEAGKPNLSDYFPFLRKLDLQGIRRRTGANYRMMYRLFDRIIEERSNARKLQGYAPVDDMLDSLLAICEANEADMAKSHIKHLFLDLISAGTDTTSSTIEWAMAELIRRPEIMAIARTELEQVTRKGDLLEEPDISSLPYLQAIVKETLRLHPPVPLLLPRKASADIDVAGFTVPKDAQVLYNVWAMGRDPTVWEDHFSFVPERFLGSDIDVKGKYFELMPFGAGRRICPGLSLAMRMLHLTLGNLLLSFDWKLADGATPKTLDMEEKFGMSLQKAKPLLVVPLPLA